MEYSRHVTHFLIFCGFCKAQQDTVTACTHWIIKSTFCQILTSRHWCFAIILLFWFFHLLLFLHEFSPHSLRTGFMAGFCGSYVGSSVRTQWTSAWLTPPALVVAMVTTYPPTKDRVVSYFTCLQQSLLLWWGGAIISDCRSTRWNSSIHMPLGPPSHTQPFEPSDYIHLLHSAQTF